MLVAVQGCSHGSLSQIYDTISSYTSVKNRTVDLLLLCGDFQALRSEFDFGSLAVPQKYHSLGTFHQYYSGEKVAPVLTIVIGGNHEASNYMWELYHGGWLAPNIYYIGAAGSVYVDGLRVVGASGIYKNHDYTKGHFEKVPYDKSTLRSVYHIRQYDIAKLMQLRPIENTIMLSHDWPISIARHGDTAALLRRKPFFRDEINSNTLGSPPLYTLLNHLQPRHWFAAHLHVKFAAIFKHEHPVENVNLSVGRIGESSSSTSTSARGNGKAENPDEIAIDDLELELENDLELALEKELEKANPDEIILDDFDGFDDEPPPKTLQTTTAVNPEEIIIDDEEFDDPAPALVAASTLASTSLHSTEVEAGPSKRRTSIEKELQVDESVDLVEAARKAESGAGVMHEVVAAPSEEAAKALKAVDVGVRNDKSGHTGRSTKFLALDKCGPGKDFIQFLDIPSGSSSSSSSSSPKLTYDKEWLAISRAFHPFLSTQIHQPTLPAPHILRALVDDEISRIAQDGLLVPSLPTDGEEGGEVKLDWEKGEIEIGRVQRFWPTAPAHGQPGGNSNAWYTNPQTEAFCGMLGVENKVNPAPRQ